MVMICRIIDYVTYAYKYYTLRTPSGIRHVSAKCGIHLTWDFIVIIFMYMKTEKKALFYAILFTVFLLTYLVTLSVTDAYAKDLNVSGVLILHYAPGLTRIAGFVSFWISRHFVRGGRGRRMILLGTLLFFLVSSVLLIADILTAASVTALFILSFSMGHLGGLVYYCMSIAFETSPFKGRIISASCSASVLLQFILTGSKTTTQLITAALLFILISYMLIRTPSDYLLEDPLPYAAGSGQLLKDIRTRLAVIAGIIFICSLLACRTDIEFVSMSFDGSINIYSFPRLAMIPGYLLMGFLADYKKNRYFGMTFFGAMLLSAILVLMPFKTGNYAFFLSVYYFFISVYVFFYTYCFISIAPRTGKPELWASLGRPLSDLCVALISFIMLKVTDRLNVSSPIHYALSYFVLLTILFIIVSLAGIDPNLYMASQDHSGGIGSPDEWLRAYPLTPRECDVARILIETDMPIRAIANELKISERSVYRYLASIYEKTGTDNRTGLIKAYIQNESRGQVP